MPFAIEALQSKSKLNNVKSRQLSRTLWPELRQKEDGTIVQAASHNIKSIVRALLTRVRGRTNRTQQLETQDDTENIATDENDDGFLEINILKRIRIGNKLLSTATTVDRK